MNKNDLITFLRNPNELKDSDLGELEKIIETNPYFLSGRLLLAKASKELKHPETKNRISSAAVYSTDRPLLKKYINDKLFFLSKAPEKEDIVESITAPTIEKESIPIKSKEPQKIEIIDKKKEEKEIEKPKDVAQEKPRREPRFDPSATASFRKKIDVKDGLPSAPPIKKDEKKPNKKTVFVGKKVDRSNRVRKKSIRDEVLNEQSPKNKLKKETPSSDIEASAENKPATPPESKKVEKPKEEIEKPSIKKTESTQKNTPKNTPTSPPSISKNIESNDSFFDEINKVDAKKKVAPPSTTDSKKVASSQKATSKESPSPEKIEEKKIERPKKIKTRANSGLNVPKVPSGEIDSLLDELKRDMESLKSSRVKFAEVQQKIEEDDEFSAALERATKKIPNSKIETEVKKTEVDEKIELDANAPVTEKKEIEETKKSSIKKEVTPEKKSKPKATKKVDTEKTKARKTTTEKIKSKSEKKTPSKTASKKKIVSKSASKPKSKKTKSEAKGSEKDEDGSGNKNIDQSSIIDKFISESPSIKYQKKKEEVENQDLSDQSTEWNKELASEYLAEIYLHQGNKKRAIEIYKALSLKFPNKKSYFADLISKTK